MILHPPAACCTVGFKHEGVPTGKLTTIAGTPSYITHPANKSTKDAVLILTDMLGHRSTNIQLLADEFAAHGYLCVVPDLFHGNPFPLNGIEQDSATVAESIMGQIAGRKIENDQWAQTHPTERVDPVIESVIEVMRTEMGVESIGGVGYCFGGKYVARFLKPGKLDVGYIAHPTFLSMEELGGIAGPLSIAAAEFDVMYPVEDRHESEKVLRNLKPRQPFQINLYSHVYHGWAPRGDLRIKTTKFAKEAAFHQAVAWFDEHIKAAGGSKGSLDK